MAKNPRRALVTGAAGTLLILALTCINNLTYVFYIFRPLKFSCSKSLGRHPCMHACFSLE